MQKCNNITQHVLLRYSCASCGSVLAETETPLDDSIIQSSVEDCPNCGRLLRQRIVRTRQQQVRQPPLPVKPEIAYDIKRGRISFDIRQIDSLLDTADRSAVCVTSKDGWHANTLVTRACVRALMSSRQGGFGSSSVIFIDAGNCSDVYECVDFARQYGLDSDKVLDRIVVSRPFTIHQLARLIVHSLHSAIRRSDAKVVVVSDVLSMFTKEHQTDHDEARWLIKEIARALKRLSALVLIIVSMPCIIPPYAGALLRVFDSRIDIAANANLSGCIQVQVANLRQRTSQMVSVPERDLQVVPPR